MWTSQVLRIERLGLAGAMLGQSSIGQASKFDLGLREGRIPLLLTLDLVKENGGKGVLLLHRKLGGFLKRFTKKFSHDPEILSDADDTRGLAIGCTMGWKRPSVQASAAGPLITLGLRLGPLCAALDPTGPRAG